VEVTDSRQFGKPAALEVAEPEQNLRVPENFQAMPEYHM
jgi:hypothetical protein